MLNYSFTLVWIVFFVLVSLPFLLFRKKSFLRQLVMSIFFYVLITAGCFSLMRVHGLESGISWAVFGVCYVTPRFAILVYPSLALIHLGWKIFKTK